MPMRVLSKALLVHLSYKKINYIFIILRHSLKTTILIIRQNEFRIWNLQLMARLDTLMTRYARLLHDFSGEERTRGFLRSSVSSADRIFVCRCRGIDGQTECPLLVPNFSMGLKCILRNCYSSRDDKLRYIILSTNHTSTFHFNFF